VRRDGGGGPFARWRELIDMLCELETSRWHPRRTADRAPSTGASVAVSHH